MKLPRDINATELIKALSKLGYEITRQTGSHIRLSCLSERGIHHITVPNHKQIRVGTLSQIIQDISIYFRETKDEIIHKLF